MILVAGQVCEFVGVALQVVQLKFRSLLHAAVSGSNDGIGFEDAHPQFREVTSHDKIEFRVPQAGRQVVNQLVSLPANRSLRKEVEESVQMPLGKHVGPPIRVLAVQKRKQRATLEVAWCIHSRRFKDGWEQVDCGDEFLPNLARSGSAGPRSN